MVMKCVFFCSYDHVTHMSSPIPNSYYTVSYPILYYVYYCIMFIVYYVPYFPILYHVPYCITLSYCVLYVLSHSQYVSHIVYCVILSHIIPYYPILSHIVLCPIPNLCSSVSHYFFSHSSFSLSYSIFSLFSLSIPYH